MHAAQVARKEAQRVDCIRGRIRDLIERVGGTGRFPPAYAVPSEGRSSFMDGLNANGQSFETRRDVGLNRDVKAPWRPLVVGCRET
jgi:hypothetical protein